MQQQTGASTQARYETPQLEVIDIGKTPFMTDIVNPDSADNFDTFSLDSDATGTGL